jgi:hypothetical protein
MTLDWKGLLAQISSLAVVAAALAWLGRELFKQWLSHGVETFKAELTRDLEAYKAQLAREGFEHQTRFGKLQGLQQEAILELYAAFREAVYTAELFSRVDYGMGFRNMDGHSADYLIGTDWGKAYRKLDEKGLLFEPALVTAMRDVLDTIEKIQHAVRDGNEPYSHLEQTSAGSDQKQSWMVAAKLVSDELRPKWEKVTNEFRGLFGIDVQLDLEAPDPGSSGPAAVTLG